MRTCDLDKHRQDAVKLMKQCTERQLDTIIAREAKLIERFGETDTGLVARIVWDEAQQEKQRRTASARGNK